jgi:hypothetical protein
MFGFRETGLPNQSAAQRQIFEQHRLQAVTNIALSIAVLAGVVTCWAHGHTVSVTISAFGAALGMGGVLGFLFGVPNTPRSQINIQEAQRVAVGAGPAGSVHVSTGPEPAVTSPDQSAEKKTGGDEGSGDESVPASGPVAASAPGWGRGGDGGGRGGSGKPGGCGERGWG